MSVQAAVALLNKNAASSPAGSRASATFSTAKLASAWQSSSNDKKDDKAELRRIRTTSSSGGVASMLSKFDQQHPRPVTATAAMAHSSVHSVSPSVSSLSSSSSTKATPKESTSSSKTDTVINELMSMYEDIAQRWQAAQRTIEQLQTTTDRAMCSQVRDYEIRIQYLSEKLEHMGQEHDELERQLAVYRGNRDAPIASSDNRREDDANTSNNNNKQRRITVETNTTRSDQPDDFWNCLLDTYEKSSVSTGCTSARASGEGEEEGEEVEERKRGKEAAVAIPTAVDSNELLSTRKQMAALERGAHTMLEWQAGELESERMQTRTLAEVVRKQDSLIAALESQLASARRSNDQLLLQEQMELQRTELQDKRALLARLLDERQDLRKRATSPPCRTPNRSRSASVRSSIDILSEMSKTDSTGHLLSRASCSSLRQQQQQQQQQQHASARSSLSASLHLGRSTPPLTAPPRDPLPPLPARASLAHHSSCTSTLSPASSWSSADYAAIKTQDICSSTVYREASPRSPSPAWLDHPPPHHSIIASMPASSVPSQQQQQQQQQTTTTSISRQPTIKLSRKRSSSNNNNSAFWKGWKNRLSSR